MSEIKLHLSWLKYLKGEFEADYMIQLKKFLKCEYDAKKIIYPKASEYFNALEHTHLDNVKVVLLGQDPYHGAGQGHGLCFSVREGVRFPPSLMNIFKELKTDVGAEVPKSGDLTRWADQGVLMLNSVLTVEDGKAAAHQKKGWEQFTDKIISVVNEECDHVVFILWGAYAQKKAAFVDRTKHLVLESVHPSPLSSHRGFFGSKPFSQANAFLKKHGLKEIKW
ncbi:MAG: uracil-DNA glycosylase [Bdellovibrio sp.]|nr:uracil-DNA glycosylase [Bdellovibrio sp.]